jgi:hypothetical protein
LLAVGLVALAAACSGGSGPGAHRSSPEKPTPASSTPPSTIDLSKPIPGGSLHGTPRPPLENTGTDYVAIFKSLDANFRWLTENPDPRVISELYLPGTPGHDTRIAAYEYLLANGYRWADEAYRLLSVTVVSVTPDVVSLRVRDSLEFERIVDAGGNQVGSLRPRSPAEKDWTVLLSPSDGHWRIADWSSTGAAAVDL